MQRIEFIGNLTGDPVQRETASGKVTNFTVAVDRTAKKDEQKVTDFFRVGAWGSLGENCFKYLRKARKVFVDGELRPRLFEGEDGKTMQSLDVFPAHVVFLDKGDKEDDKKQKPVDPNDFIDIQTDDIPF